VALNALENRRQAVDRAASSGREKPGGIRCQIALLQDALYGLDNEACS
jgi:hypothetical protein